MKSSNIKIISLFELKLGNQNYPFFINIYFGLFSIFHNSTYPPSNSEQSTMYLLVHSELQI